MSKENKQLAERVNALPWYHRIDLGNGLTTPGVVENARVLPRLGLPDSLHGRTVLDIGAWDGFYSFEAARRDAERVLATDSFSWDGRGWGSKKSFELARSALELEDRVDDLTIDGMDISPESLGGTFDVVLHLGVLYHLRDPFTALERAASVCDEMLVLETETAVNFLPYGAARFYYNSDLNGDDTNWYQYNVRALKGMLSELGFSSVEVTYRHPLYRRVARGILEKKAGRSFRAVARSARVVIHARR